MLQTRRSNRDNLEIIPPFIYSKIPVYCDPSIERSWEVFLAKGHNICFQKETGKLSFEISLLMLYCCIVVLRPW